MVDGKPNPDCLRALFSTHCPHHVGGDWKVRVELCGRQLCESSALDNSLERARDAWNGTAQVMPRGVRHFGEETALGVFVFTLPAELRDSCSRERQRKFRKAAGDLAVEVLRRHVGNSRALFAARSWFHPEGDDQPGVYKPHENVLVPLRWWDPVKRKHHGIGRAQLPKSWLGVDGWICEAWRAELVAIFGQWWPSSSPAPATLPFYEFRQKPEEKMHALKYFGRVFPRWAQHGTVHVRPRAWGLCHWKHKLPMIATSSAGGRIAALPEFDACQDCIAEGNPTPPARVVAYGAKKEDVIARMAAGVKAHSCGWCQEDGGHREDRPYLEYQRIMAREFSTGPPADTSDGEKGPSPHRLGFDPLTGEVLDDAPQGAELEKVCPG